MTATTTRRRTTTTTTTHQATPTAPKAHTRPSLWTEELIRELDSTLDDSYLPVQVSQLTVEQALRLHRHLNAIFKAD